MALAVVTCTKIRATSGNSVAGAIATPATGSLLVTYITSYNGTGASSTASDDINGSHTTVVSNDRSGIQSAIAYKANVPASATTLTVNGGSGGSGIVGLCYEVSGASTTSPFTSGEVNNATGAATTAPTTGTVTNSVAASIFFAGIDNEDADNPVNLTKDANFTRHASASELDGASYPDAAFDYWIVATSSARGCTWTTDSEAYTVVIAAFGAEVVVGQPTIRRLGMVRYARDILGMERVQVA